MRAINRKLLRDSAHMAGQLAAIALIIAAAVATYVSMRGSYEALRDARAQYYQEARFAHVFGHLKRAPLRVAGDIAAIPGVSAVDARVMVSVPLDVPGLSEPATARIISLGGRLNQLTLRSGRLPVESAVTEVVASTQFAAANKLRPGHALAAVLNGRWEPLRICAIGSTPETLVEVAGAAAIPDRERFAILWMPRREIEAAFSMRGAFNDFAVLLSPAADEAQVIDRIDNLLTPFGGTGAYGRRDHHPHQVIDSEIVQLRVTALVIPLVFLLVSAFLINMVLSRLVAGQRDQIAVLKAFGYGNGVIVRHYAGFALLVSAAGSLLGIPLGVWVGRGMMSLYLDFFNFPGLRFTIEPASMAFSVIITATAAVAAAVRSSLAAAAVPPAEGMRGEQPPSYRTTAMDRFNAAFSTATRMIFRSIQRRPLRAALSLTGIALAVMILMIGRYTYDAIDGLLNVHLRAAERHDVMLTFVEPRRATVAYDLARLPAVKRVEMFRAVPVRIRAGHRVRRIALLGLQPDSELRRLVGADGRVVPIPDRGVVLTKILADVLGAGPGSRVRFESLEGERIVFEADVVATVEEMLGTNAFASAAEVSRFMGEGDLASGAYLAADRGARGQLDRVLKSLPVIAGVAYREKMLASFAETIARSLSTSTRAIVIFACIIAFGVIYNSARIALSERGRDLATLRVLGFTRREAGLLLLGEQALLTLGAIPVGFLLGRLMAAWMSALFTTEEYRLVAELSGRTYAFALTVVIIASALSGLAVWRRIGGLDLIAVLKARE
jgi:putative ABC transport system permease protein